MRQQFVRTENARRFRSHVALQEQRGAAEAGWIVVHGRPGEGKTATLNNWAAERGAIVLTAQVDWTPRRMLFDLAERLGIETTGGFDRKIVEVIGTEELPIVVDEAGFALANNAACLEKLRGITDKTSSLVAIVLMEQDVAKLARRTQISSRARLCEFKPSTLADVTAACMELAEVEIAPPLIQRIAEESGARMRSILGAIHVVETVGRKLGKQAVGLEDVKNLQLCDDFGAAVRAMARKRRGLQGGAT